MVNVRSCLCLIFILFKLSTQKVLNTDHKHPVFPFIRLLFFMKSFICFYLFPSIIEKNDTKLGPFQFSFSFLLLHVIVVFHISFCLRPILSAGSYVIAGADNDMAYYFIGVVDNDLNHIRIIVSLFSRR